MASNDIPLKEITVHFDGLCEPLNPGGVAAYGVVVIIDGKEIKTKKGVVGKGRYMSNNVAEYAALCAAFEQIVTITAYELSDPLLITMKGDSQLVINQMKGAWQAKGGLYLDYYKKAKERLSWFQTNTKWRIEFTWVPREQNQRADQLSREAYEGYCRGNRIPVEYMNTVKTRSSDETRKVLEGMFKKPKPDIVLQDEMPSSGAPSMTGQDDAQSQIKVCPSSGFGHDGAAASSKDGEFWIVEARGGPGTGMSLFTQFNSTKPEKEPSGGEVKFLRSEPYLSGADGIPLPKTYSNLPPPSMGTCITPLSPLHMPPADTCMNCKWMQERGPHLGCYPNGKYRKWLPRAFARNNKCEKHEKK